LFAFLPIHAAGIYNTADGENASDYIVSSYTPTLSTLLVPKPLIASTFKMMVVIQPRTLPCAHEELNRIEKHVPSGCLVKLGLSQSPATVQHVTSHISGASIVHFACHGVQDAKNPLKSAVILEDGRLTVSQIMRQPMPNAWLAFLSACQTATGDGTLPDEAIHLAAAMLFAGFRGVVATMW
jgi:CHAT domain-containing protein